jgi:hypothetical protein
MTRPPHPPDEPQRAFLVERYLSPASAIGLAASTVRLAQLCAASDRDTAAVRYLYSVYLPAEDTCFCLFRASSADAVCAVNDRARFAFDRLVDAVLVHAAPPGRHGGDADPVRI